MTLVELSEALRAKKASASELMEVTLERIEATADQLNAVVALRERYALIAEAAEADARIARGEARPLEGIPLGVKDLEDAEGLVTSHGSLPFRDNRALADSTQVARLERGRRDRRRQDQRAGVRLHRDHQEPGLRRDALALGPERTAGGSSGGSAAALAGEVLPLVTASDGGGSIRIPASFTGAFGLKPSYGRVPRGPFESLGPRRHRRLRPAHQDGGGRGAGARPGRGARRPRPDEPAAPGLLVPRARARQPLAASSRIGFSPDLGYAVVQSDIVAAVVEDAASRVREDGPRRRRSSKAARRTSAPIGASLGAFELASDISPLLAEREADFSRSLMDGIRMAAGVTPRWWGEMARRARGAGRLVRAHASSDYDLLLTPTVPFDPPPAKGPFPSETEGRPQRDGAASRRSLSRSTSAGIRRPRFASGCRAPGCPSACRSSAPSSGTTSCCRRRARSSASAPGIRTGRCAARADA